MSTLRRFLPSLRQQIRAYSSAPKPPSRAPPSKAAIPPTLPRLAPALPYVPSTSHLRPADVALSSFFALHRPVSVRNPLPKPVSVEEMFGVKKEEKGMGIMPVEEEEAVIQVISVKRQRKLKMKKHKYKKLMKKTRNLRRRVERQRS